MKTVTPEYIEAFVSTCMDHGLGEEATAELYKQAHWAEAWHKDPNFREGFDATMKKKADILQGLHDTATIMPGNGFEAAKGGLLGGTLGAAAGMLPGVLGAGLMKTRYGKLLRPILGKSTASTMGRRVFSNMARPAIAGGLAGSGLSYTAANMRDKAHQAPAVSSMFTPIWGTGAPQGAAPVNDNNSLFTIPGRPLSGTSPASSPAAAPLPLTGIRQLHEQLASVQKQRADIVASMSGAGAGLGGSLNRLQLHERARQLAAQEAQLSKQLGESVGQFRSTVGHQRAQLLQAQSQLQDHMNYITPTINAADRLTQRRMMPTLGGRIADSFARFTGTDRDAEDLLNRGNATQEASKGVDQMLASAPNL